MEIGALIIMLVAQAAYIAYKIKKFGEREVPDALAIQATVFGVGVILMGFWEFAKTGPAITVTPLMYSFATMLAIDLVVAAIWWYVSYVIEDRRRRHHHQAVNLPQ